VFDVNRCKVCRIESHAVFSGQLRAYHSTGETDNPAVRERSSTGFHPGWGYFQGGDTSSAGIRPGRGYMQEKTC